MGNPMDSLSCFELVTLCLKGTCSAFGVLYSRYNGVVRNICSRVVKDREIADSLVQETFLTAAGKLHQFRAKPGEKSFKKWVWTIALNLSRGYRRRLKKENEIIKENFEKDDVDVSKGPGPDKIAESNEERGILWKAINALPELTRNCFIAYHLLDLSYKDISQAYNLNKNQIAHQLDIGRHILEGKLKGLL